MWNKFATFLPVESGKLSKIEARIRTLIGLHCAIIDTVKSQIMCPLSANSV